MAIIVDVVRVALCLNDSKDNADDPLADDASSESRVGCSKHLLPVVQGVACNVCLCLAVGNALFAQLSLPAASGFATHSLHPDDLVEVCLCECDVRNTLWSRLIGNRKRLRRYVER